MDEATDTRALRISESGCRPLRWIFKFIIYKFFVFLGCADIPLSMVENGDDEHLLNDKNKVSDTAFEDDPASVQKSGDLKHE